MVRVSVKPDMANCAMLKFAPIQTRANFPPCIWFQDLRVSLVWTDPAASTGSTSALIHDLDLVVIAQSTGTTYYPNGADEADTVNNVEKIIITDTTELETYTIQVRLCLGGTSNLMDGSIGVVYRNGGCHVRFGLAVMAVVSTLCLRAPNPQIYW